MTNEMKKEWLEGFLAEDFYADAIDYDVLPLIYNDEKLMNRALYIASTFPPRKDGKIGLARIQDMIKNHLVEVVVLDKLNEVYGVKVDFYDCGSYFFHTGYGHALPDYMSEDGKTFELKRYKLSYDDVKWHNADYHLIWLNQRLYLQLEDGSLKDLGWCCLYE